MVAEEGNRRQTTDQGCCSSRKHRYVDGVPSGLH
ncbi:Uncharacterised protein [Vibrio cholerae]|nr:Uncharacterised protein [Vibrio cholerae]